MSNFLDQTGLAYFWQKIKALLNGALDDKADIITVTTSGAVASFTDGADNLPLKSLVVNIEPVQSGSGDPSPSNVRPISGWTGCNVNANGTVIPISWQSEAGTVYGGKLDVLSGVLTVDRQFFELDGNSNVTKGSGGTTQPTEAFPYWATIYIPCNNATAKYSAWRFSHGKCQGAAYSGIFRTFKTNNTTIQVTVGTDALLSTTADAKTWLQTQKDNGKPLQIVAELTTPLTYQLSPQTVRSLVGQNNIFADTGDCSVEYRADTKLFINRLTEPDADMIADSNIVSGQYFMVGNTLYKATANIASGASVIVGTNAVRKSLSEALNEINA